MTASPERAPPEKAEIGDLVGESVDFGEARYILDKLLGLGGMGEVYRARRVVVAGMVEWSTSELAAIKVVRRDLAPHFGGNAKAFADEIRLHRYLSHPNVVAVRAVTEVNDTLYMMMDYLDGNDLRSLLRMAKGQGKQLSEGAVCSILAQVADALDYVHRATDETGRALHIVHRDVSPSNIRITVPGEVKLMDFGVATWEADWREKTRSSFSGFKGKLPYLSPEQVNREPLDGRSDLFALGSILAECLIGRHLFDQRYHLLALQAIRTVSPEHVEAALRGAQEGLKAICHRLLARDRAGRYAAGREVALALREYAFGKRRHLLDSRTLEEEVGALERRELERFTELEDPTGTGSPTPVPPESPRRRRRQVAILLTSLGVALFPVLVCLAHVHRSQVLVTTNTATGSCTGVTPVRAARGHQMPDEVPVYFASLEAQTCKGNPEHRCEPGEPLCWGEPCPAGDGEIVMVAQYDEIPGRPSPDAFLQGARFRGRARVIDGPEIVNAVGRDPLMAVGRLLAVFTEVEMKDGSKLPICGVLFQNLLEGRETPDKEGIPVLGPSYYGERATPSVIAHIRLFWP
jgi:serine/threonine protein kinase